MEICLLFPPGAYFFHQREQFDRRLRRVTFCHQRQKVTKKRRLEPTVLRIPSHVSVQKELKAFTSRCDRNCKSKSRSGIDLASNPFRHLHLRNVGAYTSTVSPSAAAISRNGGHICNNDKYALVRVKKTNSFRS